MKVAGVDVSLTRTGLAVLRDGYPIMLRDVRSASEGLDDLARNRRCRNLAFVIANTLHRHRPDLVVIEKPLTHPGNGMAFDRFTLVQLIVGCLDEWGYPITLVHNRKRPVWATGIAGASKGDVLEAVRGWWPDLLVPNDDVADAAVMACMGAYWHGDPVPFDRKPRHASGLEGVVWPDLSVNQGLHSRTDAS